jgi:hypothetical protein
MLKRPVISVASVRSTLALTIVTVLATVVWPAPVARADSASDLRDAVASAHSGISCGPLQYNDVVAHVAEVVNRSTDDYLNHTATRVPISDPLEGLKGLGYGGTKAYLLQGAHQSEANAIKGALLEGYAALTDCAYSDFGVSILRNESTGYALAAVVLAGP